MPTTKHSIVDRRKALNEASAVRAGLVDMGYAPLPACQKQVFLKGWPDIVADASMIAEWERRMDWRTTAIKIEGSLVAIDIDIDDEMVAFAVLEVLREIAPDVYETAPMRSGRGYKVMVLCRSDEPIGIIHSRLMVHGDARHRVEVFGGATTRYFTCFGPHTEGVTTAEGVEVIVRYEWEDDVSPLDMRPESLPVITRKQLVQLCLTAGELMEAHGWTPAPKCSEGEINEQQVADLTEDMTFDLETGITVPFDRLEEFTGARCSASWRGDKAFTNRSRCRIDRDPHSGIVRIIDFDEYVWHYPEDYDVRPKKVKDDEKQKSAAARLGEVLGELMVGEKTSYVAPSKLEYVEDIDGRDLESWDFVDWLMSRYAYYPSGASVERVVDVVDGTSYPLDGFHGMWVSKGWEEDTGEVYARGAKAGEPKIEKVVPTKLWFGHKDRITIKGFRFTPGNPARLIEDKGRWLNIYRRPDLITEDAIPEAADWWEGFLEHLLPAEEEREWFVNWLAYKYQNPDARGQAVLMVSPTGDAGRGILFRILGDLFQYHVASPSAEDLTGLSSQAVYNGWMETTVLATVDELMAGAGGIYDKKKAYESLKENIDPLLKRMSRVEKSERRRPFISYVSLISATNHTNALPLDATDRRFTVLSNGQKITRRMDLLERFDEMQDSRGSILPGFIRAIREWCEGVEAGRHLFMTPLMTDAKLEMIEGTEGKIEKMLKDVLRKLERDGRPLVLVQEIISKVEMEAKARGYGQGLEMAVESEVKEALRAGFEGWLYDRRALRVDPDPAVANTRNSVAHVASVKVLNLEERAASIKGTTK